MREPAHQHLIRVGLHDIDYRINYLEAGKMLSQGTLKASEYQKWRICGLSLGLHSRLGLL